MKQKTLKIASRTLFIYKQGKPKLKHSNTDTTITITTLTNTTGVFLNK